MEILKGSVYLADLNPRFGTEAGKLRPVVIIQTNLLNETGHPSTIICPITSKVIPQAKWLRVHLAKGAAGLKEDSDILIDQMRAIDGRRFTKKLGVLPRVAQERLADCLETVLDL